MQTKGEIKRTNDYPLLAGMGVRSKALVAQMHTKLQ